MKLDDLFKMHCSECGKPDHEHQKEPLVLHSRCHPFAGTWVKVDPATRVLRVECAECEKLIVEIEP